MYCSKVWRLCLLLVIGFLNLSRGAPYTDENISVCDSPVCIDAALSIQEKLDQTVNPCEDFYEFACGKYIKENVIPDDKSGIAIFNKKSEEMHKKLKETIENEINDSDPRTFHLLKSYYDICMNTDVTDKNGERDIHEIFDYLGGWPVLEGQSWDESNFNWMNLVYKLREKGFSISNFFTFYIQPDEKKSSRYVIHIDQASTFLSQEYLSLGYKEKNVQAYKKYIVNLAEIFGANQQDAEEELGEALDFEIALAKISLPAEKRRDPVLNYNLKTIKELTSEYSEISWIDYFNNLLTSHGHVKPNDEVVVVVPSFFDNFFKLIAKTPKRVLANYAFYRVALESAGSLGERVKKVTDKYNAAVYGVSVRQPRWQECLGSSTNKLQIAIGALYVRRHFSKTAKAEVSELIEHIRQSFRKMINELSWMADHTKTESLNKLKEIIPFVAYPDEFLNDEKIDSYYNDLKLHPESLLKSELSLKIFNSIKQSERLSKTAERKDWTTHYWTAIVNAMYNPTDNTIQIPAGILQGEFFTQGKPKYLNYGSIGWIIGHEITHGFDDQGSQFDATGNLFNWWDKNTKEEYLNKTQCIKEQYGNYTVKQVGLNLNGKNTLGENIADNGGIKEAYYAFTEFEQKYGAEPRLPGLPYSSRQMFWIGAANMWCAKFRDEYMKNLIITNEHSPAEFRVIGSFSNMPEFSKDFNCSPESQMNPKKRCMVW